MWTVVALLLIVWLVGLLASHTMGGWIHIVPIIALVVVVLSLISRRKRKYSRY